METVGEEITVEIKEYCSELSDHFLHLKCLLYTLERVCTNTYIIIKYFRMLEQKDGPKALGGQAQPWIISI